MWTRQLVFSQVDRQGSIPSLPEIVDRLSREMSVPQVSFQAIAALIASDPPLAARFLAVANSARYVRRGRKTTDIARAVGRLGLDETRRVVLTAAVISRFRHVGSDPRALWTHSVAVALCCRMLSQLCCAAIPEPVAQAAYTAGLLHDIGSMALTQVVGEDYDPVLDALETEGGDTRELEVGLLGVGHDEVGERLARRWELPECVCQAIRYHHQPWRSAPEHRRLVLLVHMADFVTGNQGYGRHPAVMPAPFHGSAWDALGLSLSQIPQLLDGASQGGEQSEDLWASCVS